MESCRATSLLAELEDDDEELPDADEDDNDEVWYFVPKIVLTDCEKKIVLLIEKNFEVEGRDFAKKTRSIHLNRERSIQFVKHNTCLTCSWR